MYLQAIFVKTIFVMLYSSSLKTTTTTEYKSRTNQESIRDFSHAI